MSAKWLRGVISPKCVFNSKTPFHIFETNGARKLKFGMPVGIYSYYGST